MAQRQGILGRAVRNPLTGALYADGVVPASAITPFARQVLDGLPAPTSPGTSNNFDTLPRREDYNDKFDVKVDQQFRAATTAFVRFSHRKVDNFEPPPIPGEIGSPANAFVEVLNQQLALGVTRTLSTRSLLEVPVRRVAHQGRQDGARAPGIPNMLEAYGITGLPTDEVFSGGLTQQSVGGWTAWGRQSSNPQFQDPLVYNARLNYSWIAGQPHAEVRLRVPVASTPPSTTCTRSTGPIPTRGQFSRPTGASGRHRRPYNLADFLVGRAQRLRPGQPVRLPPAAADALRLSAGRLARHPGADGEPRACATSSARRSGRTTTS